MAGTISCRELAESDVIFPGEVEGTLRFKHGITRDVIYASLGLRQRESLHRQIAELIEQRGPQGGQDALSRHCPITSVPVRITRRRPTMRSSREESGGRGRAGQGSQSIRCGACGIGSAAAVRRAL